MANVKLVAPGPEFTLVTDTSNQLYGFGRNLNGELGNGNNFPVATPTLLKSGILSISAGFYHSIVADASTVYTAGWNTYGQLGDGTINTRYSWDAIWSTPNAKVTASKYASFILQTSGDLYSTGANVHSIQIHSRMVYWELEMRFPDLPQQSQK